MDVKPIVILGGLCVVGWTLYFVRMGIREPDHLTIAKSMAHALQSGDELAVMKAICPYERDSLELNNGKVKELMTLCLPGDFEEWKLVDDGYTSSTGGGQLGYRPIFESPKGRRVTLDFLVSDSDQGRGAIITTPLILFASEVQAPKGASTIELARSHASWIGKNKQTLERIGIEGSVSEATGKVRPWASVITTLEGMASRREKLANR